MVLCPLHYSSSAAYPLHLCNLVMPCSQSLSDWCLDFTACLCLLLIGLTPDGIQHCCYHHFQSDTLEMAKRNIFWDSLRVVSTVLIQGHQVYFKGNLSSLSSKSKGMNGLLSSKSYLLGLQMAVSACVLNMSFPLCPEASNLSLICIQTLLTKPASIRTHSKDLILTYLPFKIPYL